MSDFEEKHCINWMLNGARSEVESVQIVKMQVLVNLQSRVTEI
jgi:hypothetical protein